MISLQMLISILYLINSNVILDPHKQVFHSVPTLLLHHLDCFSVLEGSQVQLQLLKYYLLTTFTSGAVTQLITLCMKLSWFCHTNSGQLFCNCPLFVIALVPGLFFGRKPDETCCHSVVASKWLETRVSHFALQDENTTT